MRSGKKYSRKVGILLFALPVLVVVGVGAYAVMALYQPGTLIVTAEYTNDSGVDIELTAPFQIGTAMGTTPGHLSEAPGTYTVAFGQMSYFRTPSDVQSSVTPGQTVYAVGAYIPAAVKVNAGSNGFNNTAIKAMRNVTPVVWVDASGSPLSIEIQSVGQISLQPGANFTHVFSALGTVRYFYTSSPSYNGTITVV